jgi:DNA-binding CsgD family transcriptional regulator
MQPIDQWTVSASAAPSASEGAEDTLLERDAELQRMEAALESVESTRAGVTIVVRGEAGIGKTALVEHFARRHSRRLRCLHGGCEALFTPRPLGPLVDLMDDLPPALADAIRGARPHHELFPALLNYLRDGQRVTMLALEDLQWADEATLDFVKYVGRRVRQVPVVFVLTYRDDELRRDHPLRRVLGDLPARSTHRVPVPLLSERAVDQLARRAGRSAEGIHRATDGNPFLVTEWLAAADDAAPWSIRDAMLARLAGLSDAARDLAELTSLSPTQLPLDVARALEASGSDAIDECVSRGLLSIDARSLRYRHELARRSVEQELSPARRCELNARMFRAVRVVLGPAASLAHLVHHAEAAGLVDEVVQLAPSAAREAARSSAHREAAELYALALKHGAGLDAAARAELLEARAHECMLTNLPAEAIEARLAALALRRKLGDASQEGINLRWLARLHWLRDADPVAQTYAEAAVAVLERLPADRELAMAYSTISQLQMVNDNTEDAVEWGERAIALAKSVGDIETLVHALNNVGTAKLQVRADETAWAMVERSLVLALAHGFEEHAARAFNNLQTTSVLHRHYPRALDYAERGIAFCEERDLDVYTARLHIRRAYAYIEMGRWDEAERDLQRLKQVLALSPMERATSGFVRALLDMRRGRPGAEQALAGLAEALRKIGVQLWFTAIAAASAEAAWLRGDDNGVDAAARPALELSRNFGASWKTGQLAAWLRRAGRPFSIAARDVASPYALELAGDWRAAASEWSRLGCPYDQGLALLSGDEAALREALQIFQRLGAEPAAELVRRRLRATGAKGIARGRYNHARTDPQGLTQREREVHELLLLGLSNEDIARRLHRSTRTIEHHVSAVLDKLGLESRAEAIALSRDAAPRQN